MSWLSLYFTILLIFNGKLQLEAATLGTKDDSSGLQLGNGTIQQHGNNLECTLPYRAIGGRCLFLETLTPGTWNEMRLFCEEVGGQMVKMNSCGLMYNIVKFIKNEGLPAKEYWIGMSDMEEEGNFVHLDGTHAMMGTPYWFAHTDSGYQEPNDGGDEDCVEMTSTYFYYLNDAECDFQKNVICEQELQKITSEVVIEEESAMEDLTIGDCANDYNIQETLPKNTQLDCRLPFLEIGGHCLFVDTLSSGTWSEMRLFCQEIGGQMLKINGCSVMYHIVQFIQNEGLPVSNYWIGMSDLDEPGHFVNLDGTSALMGTPYWKGDANTGIQEPDGNPDEHCVELRGPFYYYLNARGCDAINNVICEQVEILT